MFPNEVSLIRKKLQELQNEDELRIVLQSFFMEEGFLITLSHGVGEHGADLTMELQSNQDVIGRGQLLFFQIKKGDVNMRIWRKSLDSQLSNLYTKKPSLPNVNEKLSRRVIFMTDGHIETSVIEEINERNEKNQIPIEMFDGQRLAKLLYDKTFSAADIDAIIRDSAKTISQVKERTQEVQILGETDIVGTGNTMYSPSSVLEEEPFKRETFDQKFNQYEHIKSPNAKHLLYLEIDKLIVTIPSDSTKWDKDIKDIVKHFADETLREIKNRALVDYWLTSARTLYKIADRRTRMYYQRRLAEGVNKLYEKYRMRTRNIIEFMQLFSEFDPKVMAKLVDDSMYKWNDNEFSFLHEKIDFQSLRKVNPALLKDMEESILRKLDNARNEKKIRRLKRIYELIAKAQKG